MKEHVTSREPVMKTTAYEKVSSFLMAVVSGLTILIFILVLQLQAHEPVKAKSPPDNMEPLGGSFGDNKSKKPVGVPSPEDQPQKVFQGKVLIDIEELLKKEIDGTIPAASTTSKANPKEGQPDGDGQGKSLSRTHYGTGDGDRWFLTFNDEGSLQTYAEQLDFFKIEIAYYEPGAKTLTYVKNFSQKKPTMRVVKADKKDKRFAFLWQNNGRKAADVQLLKNAGIEVGNGVIVHFYRAQTVRILSNIERQATKRPLKDIRRTYFGVRPDPQQGGDGFKFVVTRITYRN